MDILKNPIVIGLTFGVITYAYLQMAANDKNKKKNKKNKDKNKETVNLLIPLVVSIIGWFIAYAYFEYSGNGTQINNATTHEALTSHPFLNEINKMHGQQMPLPMPLPPSPGHNFIADIISASSEPRSFSLINAGVTIPSKLPDVLLEMY